MSTAPQLLRRLLPALALAGATLLTACASRPPQPVYTGTVMPPQWEAEGKAAVRSGDRGTNVYFTWSQDGPAYHIVVRGPLGLGRAELQGQPGAVTLSADNLKQDVSASSPEELVQLMTHREIPVSDVLHWLKAEPAGFDARVSRGPDGKIRRIREDGWTINYLEWSEEAPNLPRKLMVSGPEGQATVVIGLWSLHLPPTAKTTPAASPDQEEAL